jgi:hypothetical protein
MVVPFVSKQKHCVDLEIVDHARHKKPNKGFAAGASPTKAILEQWWVGWIWHPQFEVFCPLGPPE